MTNDVELWCRGLRYVGRRSLSENERTVLNARIRPELWRAQVLKGLTSGIGLLASLGIGFFVLWRRPPNVKETASLTFVAIAIVLFTGGFLGAVLEVALGRKLVGRIFFGVAGLTALVGGPWRLVHVPIILNAGMVALGALLSVGNTMVILRWREGRRNERLFRLALEDVKVGDVLAFAEATAPMRERENVEGDDAIIDEQSEELLRKAELLPKSNLALSVNGEPARKWQVMSTLWVAVAPESRLEAPLSETSDLGAVGDHTLRQRHLTQAEINELKSFRATQWRRLPMRTLGVVYFSAVGIRMVENILAKRLAPELSREGWGFAAVIAIGYLVQQILRLRSLAADIEGRTAVVVRPSAGNVKGAPLSELLPQSRVHWMQNGNPARWRTAR